MHMKKTLLLLLIFVTGVGNYLMGQPDWDKANQISTRLLLPAIRTEEVLC